ncbi:hypothetical protein SAXI111661_12115 [Saccharomonospora xinjiangensis]|uniref:hypothetical protein n=1 Tax=Saccharomonospora xinjiangensis TaxID=75294 RepID=UPI0010703080|nr:hypothetical protein [Saccharomonospora xinjiangensis]QBQ58606.1 hypothetical protein EYD13_01095 [Saccharomonospora xinjiangensis]
MPGYEVISSAVRAEAPKWDEFTEVVKSTLTFIQGATLDTSAFFVLTPTAGIEINLAPETHQRAYEKVRAYMESVLQGAEREFPQIGDALIKAANKYDEAEEEVEFDLNEIWNIENDYHKPAKGPR